MMKRVWKGIVILGVWACVAFVTFMLKSVNTDGVMAIAIVGVTALAVIATLVVAVTELWV
jgi:hypothetical protein